MKSNKEVGSELNRREFLSTMTMAAGILALGLGPGASAVEPAFLQTSPAADRVGISDTTYRRARKQARALVEQMTLDEKISQLGSQSLAIERLNVPAYNYYTGEALHGLLRSPPVTSFPVPLALAAAWNPELVLHAYTAISDEARAYDNREKNGLSYYSPATLNLHRDPRWGRCEEAPGEDPCLAATIGVQMIRGMQGNNADYLKTTACSKYFICNNTDDDRTWVSATVDERNFWEYYIVCAVCAGQAQGTAIAEVLFGDYNPGGKLPCTWYRSLDQLPPIHDYDIRKGRTYLYFEGDPLYPFGHGLSYTTFRLDHLQVEARTLYPDENTKVSVQITNIGHRAGAGIVQLYVTPPPSPVKRPNKQLVGFQRVELQPGEWKSVVFELPFNEQAFWYWNEEVRQFVLQPGIARILIGNSSANLLLAGELTLKAPDKIQAGPDTLNNVAVKSHVV